MDQPAVARRWVIAVACLGLTVGLAVPAASSDTTPDGRTGDVTIEDLRVIFPGRVGDADVVRAGLPSLNRAMRDADITTPARKAAFLTTIAYESSFLYNAHALGDTRLYAGRGYIQLTGGANYEAAGHDLGVYLTTHPARARALEWSAPIARWYWTVNRDINPMADALDMGRVNAAIGYPPGPHDVLRCDSFKDAIGYFLGTAPPRGINCVRPASYLDIPTSTSHLSKEQWEALDD